MTAGEEILPDADPIGQHILIQEIVPGKTALGADSRGKLSAWWPVRRSAGQG
jgi:hypothetical protein